MKSLKKHALAAALCVLAAGAAHADPSIVGYWRIDTYAKPGGNHLSTQMICFNADRTWYGATQSAWNGNWFQLGNEVWWYGSVPIGQTRLATMAMGQLVDSQKTMTGNYGEWTSPGTAPLPWDKHATYTMTYSGAACPPPV